LRGKIAPWTFIYATCVDTCPLLTAKLASLREQIGPDFGANVSFVAITVDPRARHTGDSEDYAVAHGANHPGWAFLTGTTLRDREVTRRYGVVARQTARGDVDHTFLTLARGPWGVLRVQYMGVRFDPNEMLREPPHHSSETAAG